MMQKDNFPTRLMNYFQEVDSVQDKLGDLKELSIFNVKRKYDANFLFQTTINLYTEGLKKGDWEELLN